MSKFLKSISNPKLSRTEASRIAQIRILYFLLNSYLKRVWKVNNARCVVCRADEETTKHFLLKCLSYAHERWTLTQHTRKKCKALTLKTLLGDLQFTLPLAAYIHTSGRFMQSGE